MIAQSFKDYDLGPICVFASGVSDSTEVDITRYSKEYELLKKTITENKDNLFIYFSTLSVLNTEHTDYIKHKLHIESYIQRATNNFLILRLPNIVGVTKSKNQLLPFIYNSLLKKELIIVKKDTYRDLIDVEDLPKITRLLIEKKINGICNISLNNKIKVVDIVNLLIELNNISEYSIEISDGNQNITYESNIEEYYDELSVMNVIMDSNKIIEKYYSK